MNHSIDDILIYLAEATRGPHNLRPSLVGPTGAGKTARVRRMAEALSLPVHTLLLAHVMPEELAGIPHVTAKRTAWPAPEWARRLADTPHVLFLDEFDKARRDVMGATLTLLWELRVGNVQLHPDTVLVLAMQPTPPAQFLADETGKAVAARSVFLPVTYDWGYVTNTTGVDWSFMPKGPTPQLPVLEQPSPRQIEQLCNLVRRLPDDPKLHRTVVEGVVPPGLVEPTLEAIYQSAALDPVAICRSLSEGTLDPNTLEVEEIISLTAVIPEHLGKPHGATVFAVFMEKLWSTRSSDVCQAFLTGLVGALDAQRERTGDDVVEFLPGVEPDELYDALEPVVERLQR